MAEEELESFRRQWQQEVSSRNRGSVPSSSSLPQTGSSHNNIPKSVPAPRAEPRHRAEDDTVPGWNFDHVEEQEEARKLGESGSGVHPESRPVKEPQSALEHYERAVEREGQGKLGDSLAHYRRAFRLDDNVDKKYKNKHFPPSSFPPKAKAGSGSTSGTTGNTVPSQASNHAPQSSVLDLIASFSNEPITGAPPLIERTPPPPCPISSVPSEILSEILLSAATIDLSSFSRLSLVCKRFAFLTATEDQIWKRVVHGPKFGFAGMHFKYGVSLSGQLLATHDDELLLDLSNLSLDADPAARKLSEPLPGDMLPLTMPLTSTYPTYRHMQRLRPRIRFAGLYISTVNYVRPGAASATSVTWGSPVHVVTYYRYLRFYRDGSALSLLSTAEPSDVVPHLRSENVGIGQGAQAAAGGGSGIVAVAKNTLRGRWRISPLEELQKAEIEAGRTENQEEQDEEVELEPEGNVYIETKGPTAAYTYTMQLALRSGGSKDSARNTKLVWRGFWSYNSITDDWAEFGLKNDRAFVWSRVRSWADS